jgi:hypothetical protein
MVLTGGKRNFSFIDTLETIYSLVTIDLINIFSR